MLQKRAQRLACGVPGVLGAFSLALSLCVVSSLPARAADAADSEKTAVKVSTQAVRRMNLVLLQNQAETTSAISVEKFTEFVKAVEGAVNTYLSGQAPYSTTQLLLHCSMKPGGPVSFSMTTKPGLPGRISAGLDEALSALAAPPVKSPLNMEFVFTVADHQTQLSAEARPMIRAGKVDEAVAMLDAEATADCKNPYVFQTLGWAYSAKGDFVNAEKTLKRAIELAPRDFDTWSNLVSTYHSEGKIKEADEAAQKSLDCAPDQDATNVVNINNALYGGDWPTAEAILRKQVERPGQNVAPYQVILACTLRWQGKNEEAKKLLKVAIAQNLDDYYARLAKKQLALLDGDWKTAEELGRTDLSKDPKDYESLFDMGVALKGEGKLEEAREAFQAAVQPVTPKSILNAVNLQIKELSKN